MHLTRLAATLASHVGRSETTVAGWCGVHKRLFTRISEGNGCRVDTFNKALMAFSELWPADLEWPQDIPRPQSRKKKEIAQ